MYLVIRGLSLIKNYKIQITNYPIAAVVEQADTKDLPSTTQGAGYPEPSVVRGKIQIMYYVYILKSERRRRLYIGRTKDLKRRFQEHLNGKIWTTKRMLPIKLIFYEAFINKKDAVRRERYLKTTKGKATLKMMLKEVLN